VGLLASIRPLVAWWIRFSDVPLIVIAFFYIGIYSYQVLLPPGGLIQEDLQLIATFIYWIFFIDIVLRTMDFFSTTRADRSLKDFLFGNFLSIVAVAAPVFRSLRIFRLIIALRGIMSSSVRRAESAAIMVMTSFPIILYTSALAVLDAERDAPGSNIMNIGDAIWWSGITMTTVGYGDHYPVTLEGRLIAAGLLITGIAVISTLTAIVSRWIFAGEK